jgi:hypothetical protein
MRRFVIVMAVAVFGCQGGTTDGDELGEARAQVRRYFDAIATSDCSTLTSLVPAANTRKACEQLLHEWRDDLRIKLLDVSDVRRDGRDHRAIIVRTTVMRRDQQQTMLIRVTHEHGAWQLAL